MPADRSRSFLSVADWPEARRHLAFVPARPSSPVCGALRALEIHVADHRGRPLPIEARSVEAHYERLVIDQKCLASTEEATALTTDVAYGEVAIEATVNGTAARCFARGPAVPASDPDGRRPAVVAWAVGRRFHLIASVDLDHEDLLAVARSMDAPSR